MIRNKGIRSLALRVIGPHAMYGSGGGSGKWPVLGMTPWVGLWP